MHVAGRGGCDSDPEMVSEFLPQQFVAEKCAGKEMNV